MLFGEYNWIKPLKNESRKNLQKKMNIFGLGELSLQQYSQKSLCGYAILLLWNSLKYLVSLNSNVYLHALN